MIESYLMKLLSNVIFVQLLMY